MLRRYATVFWDFDGVIKDSIEVKSRAFEQLFAPFGAQVASRVREHHEHHGGMSRYEKLPLYLEWAGRERSTAEVSRYCDLFSATVRQAVIDSAWVPGAREYLQANHTRQCFVLVTATPHKEMAEIVRVLGIAHWFRELHGAPVAKADAVALALKHLQCSCHDALLIGDSQADYAAAKAAGVDFLLRRTTFNRALQREYTGPQCENFHDN
jgi:phosphoglycolate phosphatase-like HAD superfamily hydrolase